MAEVIQICFRTKPERVNADNIERLSERVLPDNVSPDPPLIIEGDRYLIGVLNPRGVHRRNDSIGLGTILDEEWATPDTQHPSGSYAIFRNDAKNTEFVSDIVGSRTIWYGSTNGLFVASTLQRAVVTFLQQYTPDPQTQAWMLSSGTLGPYRSWAKEVEQLRPNSILRLDRESWSWETDYHPATFETVSRSFDEHYRALVNTIEDTLSAWPVSTDTDVLTLSGGYDSRILLHHFSNQYPEIKTLTWGTPQSIETDLSDAAVAKRLADSYAVGHQFKPIRTDTVPVNVVIDRFITAGEGRIDHLSGYLDGFALWDEFHAQGTKQIIRGDEGFGWVPSITRLTAEKYVRRGIGLTTVSDISELDKFDIANQQLPDYLRRNEKEHLGDWRDRLYQEVRIPTTLAALNTLKSPYVELSNPLLSKEIISCVRQLPSELRDSKGLFTKYVDSITPKIPYATTSANPDLSTFLTRTDTVKYLKSELEEAIRSTELPPELIIYISKRIRVSNSSSTTHLKLDFKRIIKKNTPRVITDIIKRLYDDELFPGYNRLGFRIIIISKMNKNLTEDSEYLTN
ncbi:hypothetical protein KM295_06345 [Natronomonas sp. F2-12]|uniref:Asparagine synthetase domain-containing protein n=1 Tax=Natronomonas aquatica TaxID=2841590 RepID=A0A9R1CT59_9EURY|nr:hypothetical protein [Natronomonas aquatica]MCQ4333121.1 hypothetical protein [Natronomonas aquatica]